MATPFVAGSAALLLQAHGKGKDVYLGARTLFETTAVAVPSDKTDGSPLQTLTQAGAGLINVNNAINYKSTLTPGEILLNDTAHFNGAAVLTIKNSGKAQTFKLTHVPVGTALTIEKVCSYSLMILLLVINIILHRARSSPLSDLFH